LQAIQVLIHSKAWFDPFPDGAREELGRFSDFFNRHATPGARVEHQDFIHQG
jgi:hypothetical protein